MDAMSYVLIISPCTTLALCIASVMMCGLELECIITASWSSILQWWPRILFNCTQSFGLQVVTALLIRHTSGISVVLAERTHCRSVGSRPIADVVKNLDGKDTLVVAIEPEHPVVAAEHAAELARELHCGRAAPCIIALVLRPEMGDDSLPENRRLACANLHVAGFVDVLMQPSTAGELRELLEFSAIRVEAVQRKLKKALYGVYISSE